jgi:hypothetical protein
MHRRETGVVEDLLCFLGKPRVLIDLGCVGSNLFFTQFPQHGAQLIVLVG